MAENPHIDDRTFFAMLDGEERRRHELMLVNSLTWKGVSEDRERVHDVLRAKYAAIGLAPPKFCWARSPYAMFGAMSYLRQMQIGTRQETIKAIVPSTVDPLEVEAKRTFLEALFDRDLSVTMGGNLRDQLFSGRPDTIPACIPQLAEILAWKFTPPPNGKPLPAGWKEWVVYPLMRPFNYDLQAQTICLAVFVRCAWMSRPPVQFEKPTLCAMGGWV